MRISVNGDFEAESCNKTQNTALRESYSCVTNLHRVKIMLYTYVVQQSNKERIHVSTTKSEQSLRF